MPLYAAENPDVQYAYLTIAGFFDAYALARALAYTRQTLKTADSDRYWKGDPSAVLYFFEKLQDLVMAALTLQREEAVRPAALVALAEGEAPSLIAYHQYCGRRHQSDPWYFFPRSLGRADYANPYRVFARLAAWGGRKRWKTRLRDLRFFALSTSSLSENGDAELNTLQLYFLLTKLVEAAHLINVRAVNETRGPRQMPAGTDDPNETNAPA